MRVSSAVVILLAVLAPFCLADDSTTKVLADPPASKDSSLRVDPNAQIFETIARPSDRGELNFSLPEGSLHLRSDKKRLVLESNETCYTMRSYVVEREDPASDAVRPKGYSTCQPSSKFDLRNAVAPVTDAR